MFGIFGKLRNLISALPRSRIIFLLGGLVLLLAIPLTVFVAQQQQKTKQHASFTNPASKFSSFTKDYQQAIAEKAIDPAREILEVSLDYDESKDPQVSVSELRRLSGYVPAQFENLSPNAYTLQELDGDSRVLYRVRFEIPNDIHVDPNPDGTITAPVYTQLKQTSFIQNLPYYSAANSIMLFDPQGKTITVKFLKDVPRIDNKPDFRVINGEDVVQLLRTEKFIMNAPKLNMNKFIPIFNKAFAQERKRKVNLAFIGDRYTGNGDTEKFYGDVKEIVEYLFMIEPFKTRASQINIIIVDNTESKALSLECKKGIDVSSMILGCDTKRARRLLNSRGGLFDVPTIIANDSEGIPNGGGFILMTNIMGTFGKVFVHELGHALAKLDDEYIHSDRLMDKVFLSQRFFFLNQLTDNPGANCIKSEKEISTKWKDLVGAEDVYKGCTHNGWYRSSEDSLLRSSAPYFNAVSQKEINNKINQIAGPYTEDKIPPQVKFQTLVSGGQALRMQASATDNKGVAYVQFWVDGVFLRTAYISSAYPSSLYEFILDTSSWKNNEKHVIGLKAYDVSGNMGETKTEYFLSSKLQPASKSISPTSIVVKPSVIAPTPTLFLIAGKSQNIKVIPPAPSPNKNSNGEGILSGEVFLKDNTIISNDNISCAMYIFLKDSVAGNEIGRFSLPVSKDMGRRAYMFKNLDMSKDYIMSPAFYNCNGWISPFEFFVPRQDFNSSFHRISQDFIITYLSDTLPTPTLTLTPTPAPTLTLAPTPISALTPTPIPTPTSVPQASCSLSLTKADANCDGRIDMNDFNKQRDYAIGGQMTEEQLTLWVSSVWSPAFSNQ